MMAELLEGGFADPPREAAAAFRGVMGAMARPGTIHSVTGAEPPAPVSPAAGVVLLTLCDPETPVYLAGDYDRSEIRQWLAFHTGAPIGGPETCVFALGRWEDLKPLERFPIGTAQYPDRSATLIVERPSISATGAVLSGPGIKDTARLELPDDRAFASNHARFPLGLDFVFTSGGQLAALPRSTRVG